MLNASTADPAPVDDPSVGIAVTGESNVVDGLSEWPPLTDVADGGVLDDDSIDWLEHALPPELSDIPVDTPEDVIWIMKESLVKDRYRAPAINPERKHSWRSSFGSHPSSPVSRGSNSAGRRHHSVSHSSQFSSARSEISHASTKSTPGYTVKMGPLGWIIVPDKSEDLPKKSKSTKEGGFKKLLKDRHRSGECASCLNSLSARYMVPLRCQHKYCNPCFSKLVSISMKHENIFPPKCCLEDIPMKTIVSNLSRVLVDEYRLKEEEYSTPVSARWYCPSKPCSKWIPPTKLTRSCDTQRCPHCHAIICATCRSLTHGKKEGCSQDFGSRAAPREEETKNSIECYRCRSMVSLNAGYQNILCPCGARFCCICGVPSQSCSCTEIDVARWQEGMRTRRRGRSQSTNTLTSTSTARYTGRISEDPQQSSQDAIGGGGTTFDAHETRILEEITGKIRFLRIALSRANKYQQTALISRHRSEGYELETRVSSSQALFDQQCNRLTATLEVNLKSRREVMATEHASEFDKLRAAHEDEEDETFMNLCRYLKNKPNREAREAGIIDKLKATQEEELVALEERQKAATRELEFNGRLELKGLVSGMGVQRQEEQRKEQDAVTAFSRMVNIERSWFDAAIKKRSEMLEQLRMDLMDAAGVKSPSIPPPRDSAVELPANEEVIGYNREQYEAEIQFTSKLHAMIL